MAVPTPPRDRRAAVPWTRRGVAVLLALGGAGALAPRLLAEGLALAPGPARAAPLQPDPTEVPLPLTRWGSPPVPTGARPWPGLDLRGRFAGDRLAVTLPAGEGVFRLTLGTVTATLDATAPGRRQIDGLGPGPHDLRLVSLGEAGLGPEALPRFAVPPGAALAAPAPGRWIEVIGDSDSTGFGARHEGRDCDPAELRAATDSTLAWPARVAAVLGAGLRLRAQSGIGLVRNYANDPAPTMPARLAADPAPPGDEAAAAILVALGSNDFSDDAPQPGERWPDRAALAAAFAAAMERLLADLRAAQPGARIVLVAWPNYGRPLRRALVRAREARLAAGETALDLIDLPRMSLGACLWHPTEADHAAAAAAVLDHLAAVGIR